MKRQLAGYWTLIVAVAALIVAIAQAPGGEHSAQKTLVTAAVRADNTTANKQAVPDCNPALGAAKLGVCGPQSGPSAALAKAAGDPFNLRGTLGVDVSSYQGCPHAFGGVAFVFAKATESTGYVDRCLASNVASAKAHRLVYGTYDFLRPSYAHTATAEAEHYVQAVVRANAQKGIAVADVEANAGLSGAAVHSYVCAWVSHVRLRLHPRTVVIYTGNWFWQPQVRGGNCGARLWISAYASYAVIPTSWGGGQFKQLRYDPLRPLWQYSDGIFGPTPHLYGWDSDFFNGTRAQLRGLIGPTVQPISKRARGHCSELTVLRGRAHKHRRARHVPLLNKREHARASKLRRGLARRHYKCVSGRVSR